MAKRRDDFEPREIPFPLLGLNQNWALAKQPERTTPDCLNVRAFDPVSGRARGAQRCGLKRYFDDRVDGSSDVQEIVRVTETSAETIYKDKKEVDLSVAWSFDHGANVNAIAVDADGTNVYIAGVRTSSISVRKLTGAAGTGVWTFDAGDDMNGIAVDSDGNVYVVGVRNNTWTGASGFASVWKLDSSGSVVWVYDTGGNANAVAVDPSGNVYVAGDQASSQSMWKLNSSGVLQWDWNAAGNAYAIAVDTERRVYVGFVASSSYEFQVSGTHEIVILEADGSGLVQAFVGSGTRCVDIAIANNGDWVSAHFDHASTDVDTVIMRELRASTGKFINKWTHDTGDDVRGVAVNSDGDVYLAGDEEKRVEVPFNSGSHASTGFSVGETITGGTSTATGKVLAVNTLSGTWAGNDAVGTVLMKVTSGTFQASETLTGGTSTATATSTGTGTVTDETVWKFDSAGRPDKSGNRQWGFDSGSDKYGIAIDNDRNIYLAGLRAASTTCVQKMATTEADTIVTVPRTIKFVVAAGGDVGVFRPGGRLVKPDNNNGVLVSDVGKVFGVEAFGKVFFVDGTNDVYYDPVLEQMITYAATSGTGPSGARLIALWRGRVVRSGTKDDGQNWFMTKVGDPFDYNYAPTTPAETDAVAGNNSQAGKVGDIINTMIPYNDDLLIFGCDSSIWRLTGDPMAGGRIDLVSDITGMAWGRPWCKDPQGFIYFFGSKGGLYRMAPGAIPESLSDERIKEALEAIDLGKNQIRMTWNHEEKGVHIMVTPFLPTTKTTHYYWDHRMEGFWPDGFEDLDHNPSALYALDADDPNDRTIILGGRDGYLRTWDPAKKEDDDAKLKSHIAIGPIVLGGTDREFKLTRLTVVLAEASDGCDIEARFADNADLLLSTDPKFTKTLTPGRNGAIRNRARGFAGLITLRNDNLNETWSLEAIGATFGVAGKTRVR
jgi:hypothetical protein